MNVDWIPAWEWSDWMPVFKKVAVLALSAGIAYASGSAEIATKGELDTTESVATEVIRLDSVLEGEYETIYDMIRYNDAHEAGCDAALEMFNDPSDFAKVVEKCHSEGVIE